MEAERKKEESRGPEIVIDLDEVNGKVARSPTKVRDDVIRDIKVVWESVMGLGGSQLGLSKGLCLTIIDDVVSSSSSKSPVFKGL